MKVNIHHAPKGNQVGSSPRGNGGGATHGNGHSQRAGNGASRMGSPPIPIPARPPRYDAGLRFDSGIRYADPSVPASDGAKVKLDLAGITDADLAKFCEQHILDMQDNALYPAPTPSAVDFASLVSTFETDLTLADSARAAAKTATATKNATREAVVSALRQRGNYVQVASNGNTAAILSSGLPVQKARSPKGVLACPGNVKISLGETAGAMGLSWDAVAGNEGYLVRCSKDVTPREWSQLKRCSKTKLDLADLEIGTTYVFQLATAGGEGGQSVWSPEVKRTAG